MSSFGEPAGGPEVAGEPRPVDQAHGLLGEVLHELRRAPSHRRERSGLS